MRKELYIIGNGFDLWHDLLTSYKCFNCFMHRIKPKEHKDIGQLFNSSNQNILWSDFENMLSELDVLGMVKRYISTWNTYDNKCRFRNFFDTLHQLIKDSFHEWVIDIDYSFENHKRMSYIFKKNNALFLSFNYTNTLEKFYEINNDKICYIHGFTGNNSLYRPVVGHGVSDDTIEKKIKKIENDINNLVVQQNSIPAFEQCFKNWKDDILEQITEFLMGLRKKTDYYMGEYQEWFSEVTDISDIYILGHSLCMVDAPYFVKIHSNLPNATWHISYCKEEEKGGKVEDLCKLLNTCREKIKIELFKMDDLI